MLHSEAQDCGAPALPAEQPADVFDIPPPPEERISWFRPIVGFSVAGLAAFLVLANVGRDNSPQAVPHVLWGFPPRDMAIDMFSPDGVPRLDMGSAPLLPVVHVSKPARVTTGAVHVTGRLPPEVVTRIVRQNQGRFRLCYSNGLRNNPNLMGRISVRFVIGRDGAVSIAQNGGSDLPDSQVVSCVVRSFHGLSFPRPDGGVVTVTYPLFFRPG